MSNPTLTMWDRTPEEWAEETRDSRVNTRGLATFPLLKTEAYLRTIVVHFYSDMSRYKKGLDPDMEALFELDAQQNLDMSRIAKRWGLESCAAIDPYRWTLFDAAREDKLSGFAVQALFDRDGAINVVERTPSPRVLAMRARRRWFFTTFGPLIAAVNTALAFLVRVVDILFSPIESLLERWSAAYNKWYEESFPPDSFEEEGLHSMMRFFRNLIIFGVLFYVAWSTYWSYECSQSYTCRY